MRLWHTDLINVLPRQQILGQWRELNSIFKLQNRHVLINFVYGYTKEHLMEYSLRVIHEMKKRRYNCDIENFSKYFEGVDNTFITHPFTQKMTDRYLRQCYYNLQEKYDCGAITAEEWKKIEDKFGGKYES